MSRSMYKHRLNLLLCILLLLVIASCSRQSTEPNNQVVGNYQDTKILIKNGAINELVLNNGMLYACAGRQGIYRWNTHTSAEWEYLGLADSLLLQGFRNGVNSLWVSSDNQRLIVGRSLSYNEERRDVSPLLKSDDAGKTWLVADNGMDDVTIFHLASYNAPLPVIFAGSSGAIYKYDGSKWIFLEGNTGTGLGINSITTNPLNRNEIWAVGETSRFAPYILKSQNGGMSWSRIVAFHRGIGPYYPDGTPCDIEINPINPRVMYLGMLGAIAKTVDGGTTWQQVLGYEDGIYYNWRLSINPSNPEEVLSTGRFLYRTADDGKTWQKIALPDDKSNRLVAQLK